MPCRSNPERRRKEGGRLHTVRCDRPRNRCSPTKARSSPSPAAHVVNPPSVLFAPTVPRAPLRSSSDVAVARSLPLAVEEISRSAKASSPDERRCGCPAARCLRIQSPCVIPCVSRFESSVQQRLLGETGSFGTRAASNWKSGPPQTPCGSNGSPKEVVRWTSRRTRQNHGQADGSPTRPVGGSEGSTKIETAEDLSRDLSVPPGYRRDLLRAGASPVTPTYDCPGAIRRRAGVMSERHSGSLHLRRDTSCHNWSIPSSERRRGESAPRCIMYRDATRAGKTLVAVG